MITLSVIRNKEEVRNLKNKYRSVMVLLDNATIFEDIRKYIAELSKFADMAGVIGLDPNTNKIAVEALSLLNKNKKTFDRYYNAVYRKPESNLIRGIYDVVVRKSEKTRKPKDIVGALLAKGVIRKRHVIIDALMRSL